MSSNNFLNGDRSGRGSNPFIRAVAVFLCFVLFASVFVLWIVLIDKSVIPLYENPSDSFVIDVEDVDTEVYSGVSDAVSLSFSAVENDFDDSDVGLYSDVDTYASYISSVTVTASPSPVSASLEDNTVSNPWSLSLDSSFYYDGTWHDGLGKVFSGDIESDLSLYVSIYSQTLDSCVIYFYDYFPSTVILTYHYKYSDTDISSSITVDCRYQIYDFDLSLYVGDLEPSLYFKNNPHSGSGFCQNTSDFVDSSYRLFGNTDYWGGYYYDGLNQYYYNFLFYGTFSFTDSSDLNSSYSTFTLNDGYKHRYDTSEFSDVFSGCSGNCISLPFSLYYIDSSFSGYLDFANSSDFYSPYNYCNSSDFVIETYCFLNYDDYPCSFDQDWFVNHFYILNGVQGSLYGDWRKMFSVFHFIMNDFGIAVAPDVTDYRVGSLADDFLAYFSSDLIPELFSCAVMTDLVGNSFSSPYFFEWRDGSLFGTCSLDSVISKLVFDDGETDFFDNLTNNSSVKLKGYFTSDALSEISDAGTVGQLIDSIFDWDDRSSHSAFSDYSDDALCNMFQYCDDYSFTLQLIGSDCTDFNFSIKFVTDSAFPYK